MHIHVAIKVWEYQQKPRDVRSGELSKAVRMHCQESATHFPVLQNLCTRKKKNNKLKITLICAQLIVSSPWLFGILAAITTRVRTKLTKSSRDACLVL